MRKTAILAAGLFTALFAYADNTFTGTYLMTTTDDMGRTSESQVTISESETPGMVEVTGIIGNDFENTVLTAAADTDTGVLSFASGQEGEYWGSPVSLTLFEETAEDFAPTDGPVKAVLNADGKIVFEGIWGFWDAEYEEIVYVVTAAELVKPNASMTYTYQSSTQQQSNGTVALNASLEDGRLTVPGFSPIPTDNIGTMVFVIDEENSTATLAHPETPNTAGYYEDNYVCTITGFSGNYQDPQLKFEKGITCKIENDNALVFPARWAIVRINRDDSSAEPMLRGMFAGGKLTCDMNLVHTGVGAIGQDSTPGGAVYYDLMGRKLSNPAGICIVIKDGKASKILFPQAK